MTGERKGLRYDTELLYFGAMFRDMGLIPEFSSPDLRFEVDSANAPALRQSIGMDIALMYVRAIALRAPF